jgi:serine protease AprX
MITTRAARQREVKWKVGGRAATTLALMGIVAASIAVAGEDPAVPSAAGPSPISLSMEVQPGEPVPLELVKWKSTKELADKGFGGQGIDVALIDSGVAPVDGLDKPGKIIYGPDLSNEGGQPNLANLDTYGHGTHMAGIIAGDDGDQVVGVAPDSRIVSIKVAGASGETDIAQVIAGIDWVIEHKNDNDLNIRVLNLSLGVAGVPSSAGDPLSAAAERAWNAGIVVVAAAGNRGNGAGGIDSPAVSPYVIAVGAVDQYDQAGKNDTVATSSSGGNETRFPDLVAAGRSIMSFRVAGSMLDQLHPEAVVGDDYFVGSGTSQSAALVSGFTAALLSRDPSLTPDQVKYHFERYATDVAPGELLDGSGKIDAWKSAKLVKEAKKDTTQNHPLALPTNGSNDVATPTGATWSGGSWSGATWSGGVWSGATWSGATWSGATWSGGVWSGATWSGATWSGATWSGATWSGATWSGATWSGATWSGATWSGNWWSTTSLSGSTWS